jgi:hypothetical protein
LANQNADLLNSVSFLHRNTLLAFIDKLQRNSRSIFPEQLRKYASSLKSIINPENSGLISKWEELEKLLHLANITLTPDDLRTAESRPPDYFQQILNDLKDMASVISLPELSPDLESFLSRLPASLLEAAAANAPERNTLQLFRVISQKDDREISIVRIVQERLLCHILFCLCCGGSLYVRCAEGEKAVVIAEKIAVLSPFPEPFPIMRDWAKPVAVRSAIVLPPEDGGSDGAGRGDGRAILEIDDRGIGYKGEGCPGESVLFKELQLTEESEEVLIAVIANDMKRIYGRFNFRRCQWEERGVVDEDVMMNELKQLRFWEGDRKMVRFWMTKNRRL